MKTVKWYHFWNSQSGCLGGIIFGTVLGAILFLMLMLFFAVFRAHAGDMELVESIQKIQQQINRTQDMINKLENPNVVVWIQLYNRSKIKGDDAIYFLSNYVRTTDITDDLLAVGIDVQQNKKEWAEKLKARKRLLERQLHDMLWCK